MPYGNNLAAVADALAAALRASRVSVSDYSYNLSRCGMLQMSDADIEGDCDDSKELDEFLETFRINQ